MLYERLKTETANQRHQKFDVERSNLYLFPKRFEQQTTTRQTIALHHCKKILNSSIPSLKLELKKQIKYIHVCFAGYKTHWHKHVFCNCSQKPKPWIKDTRILTWRHLICIFFPKHLEQQATQAECKYHQSITPEFWNSSIPSTRVKSKLNTSTQFDSVNHW